jgi:protein-S-isoprenylcysteine O-methyltransferase Ste14
MPLVEELERTGNVLFRWRSYLPLILVVLIAASLPFLGEPFQSPVLDLVWELFSIAVSLLGLFVRILTIGYAPRSTSGRNTKKQVADTLSTTGMYSLVRHPLYLGNFLLGLGVSLILIRAWWIPAIYALSFTLYYERIMLAEEQFLRGKFGEAYLAWTSRTHAIIPRLRGWAKPPTPFSTRQAIRREYQSAFGLALTLFLAEQFTEVRSAGWFSPDREWLVAIVASITIYLIFRFLHKKTRLLSSRPVEYPTPAGSIST